MTTRWEVERALDDSGLPAAARLVERVLLSRTDDGGTTIPAKFMPSLADLAHDTGYGRRTVMRALDVLESGGWLSRRRDLEAARKEGKPTSYRPKLPPSARAALEARATVTLDPRATVTLGLGPEGHQARGEGRGRARATVAHKARTPEHQTTPPTPPRDPRTLLDGLGVDGGLAEFILAWLKDNTDDPFAYLLAVVGNDRAAGFVEQRRRELADLDDGDDRPPPKPPWCGECDEETRLVGMYSDDHPARCIRCHPLSVARPDPEPSDRPDDGEYPF